jgi:hypothetical protein
MATLQEKMNIKTKFAQVGSSMITFTKMRIPFAINTISIRQRDIKEMGLKEHEFTHARHETQHPE